MPANRNSDFMLSLVLTLEYPDEKIALNIYNSLEPDNKEYVKSVLDGCKLTLTTEADCAGTLRNAADDLLACIKIAEEASGFVGVSAADFDSDSLFE